MQIPIGSGIVSCWRPRCDAFTLTIPDPNTKVVGPERHADSDLPRTPRNAVRSHAVEAQRGERHRAADRQQLRQRTFAVEPLGDVVDWGLQGTGLSVCGDPDSGEHELMAPSAL